MGARAESPRARRWRCVARGARGPARAAQKDHLGRTAPRRAPRIRGGGAPRHSAQCTDSPLPHTAHRPAPTGGTDRHRPTGTGTGTGTGAGTAHTGFHGFFVVRVRPFRLKAVSLRLTTSGAAPHSKVETCARATLSAIWTSGPAVARGLLVSSLLEQHGIRGARMARGHSHAAWRLDSLCAPPPTISLSTSAKCLALAAGDGVLQVPRKLI